MSRQRHTFTAEFKNEAASLVHDQGYSYIEAARSLRLVESALRRWVSQPQQERGGVTLASKVLTPEQQQFENWKPESIVWNGESRSSKRPPRS
jgi:transposase